MKGQESGYWKDDFFKLFVKREWKIVVGKKYSNLWLLAGMLTVTFLAVSFSNASLRYLSDKMNDPFIKWVDIVNSYGEGNFSGLKNALGDDSNMEKYDYDSFQSDYYFSYTFFGAEKNMLQYYRCRFFQDFRTPLVDAILDDENIVNGCRVKDLNSISEKSIGVVITEGALRKLGFEDAPAYLDLCQYNPGADSLGFELYANEFARIPVPVLAVVKRLPSSVDVISTDYFFRQVEDSHYYPFNLCNNRPYSESLVYFVPDNVRFDDFCDFLESSGRERFDDGCELDKMSFYKPEILSFKEGQYVCLVSKNDTPLNPVAVSEVNDAVLDRWKDSGVVRVFDYKFSNYEKAMETSYLSVNFNSLNNIKDFETFVGEYNVKIDMTQINSKENYNAVSIMGNVLSWAIIAFAIICIVLFLVDLLKSYFQKVKRNIGTFKAFGVSNRRLVGIYTLIVGATVLAAIVISLVVSFLIQESFILSGVLKDGEYSYFALGSFKSLTSVVIIALASVCTVYAVMRNLLRHTPGNLIYDR